MNKKNTLFNEITIKRLVSDTKLTAKQKRASQEWINLIEEGKLQKEKQGYLKFYDLILKDLLGYVNIKHEKEGVEFSYDKNGKNIVRIEAKGMDTKDLFLSQKRAREESPVQQLWRYMQLHASPYGIVTNYQIFILFKYDVGSTKYYLFDFQDIKSNPNKLEEFVAIFSRENIDKGFVENLYEKSIIEEKEFTKEFYKLYHETRLMLIKEFEENSEISRGASVHFAQLYLNRLMFVFFAEDTGKIDKRLVEDRIIKTLDNVHLFSSNSSNISKVLVGLFNDLNKGSDFPIKLFGFNGGLFKHPIPPKIFFIDFRDNKFFKDVNQYSKLKKKDLELNEKEQEIFQKYKNKINPIIRNILLMASFDFNTEVNVNILGHIFEQSISDIEDLKSDKDSRRKKEGIFYTPEYITDYICRNTIITYLSKKGVNGVPNLIKEYAENINELESKFKSLKILDPACGSGAFLIKSTDIMLEIFKAIQEFKQQKGAYEAKSGLKKKNNKKGQLNLEKWNEEIEAREIIENSIYGVDINEESVEITKLSLFLKMARKNRKLTDLSDNIKQGNSLIDDKEIDDRAFEWKKEFPFKFDVVIGNPPYVRVEFIPEKLVRFYKEKYKTSTGKFDLSSIFIEKCIDLLNDNGKYSIISSYQFIYSSSGIGLRKYLTEKVSSEIIKFDSSERVFEGATTYPAIFIFTKKINDELLIKEAAIKNESINIKRTLRVSNSNFQSKNVIIGETKILERIYKDPRTKQGSKIGVAKCGVVSSADDVFFINKNIIEQRHLEHDIIYPIIGTNELYKWHLEEPSTFCIYTYYSDDKKTKLIELNDLKIKFPNVHKYILDNEKRLRSRSQGRKNYSESPKWYQLNRPREKWIYDSKKIIYPGTSKSPKFALDQKGQLFRNARTYCFILNEENIELYKYLLCILNSNLSHFIMKLKCPPKSNNYYELSTNFVDTFPFIMEREKEVIEKCELIIQLESKFYEQKNKFLRRIFHNMNLKKITKNIMNFYKMDTDGFFEELEKNKVSLTLKDQDKWEGYFNSYRKSLNEIISKVAKLEKETNNIVYKIYRITPEEQKIIEESLK